MKITILKEEWPFLVAGKSIKTGNYVIGYPYFYKKNKRGHTRFCPCILLPTEIKGRIESRRSIINRLFLKKYSIAFLNKEFHPVQPEEGLHRFIKEDDFSYIFEDGITIPKTK